MWKNKLSFFLLFFSASVNAAQVGLQYYDESAFEDQVGILASYSQSTRKNLFFEGGVRLLRNAHEWTRFEYKLDTQWFFLPWASLHLRAAHRIKHPTQFSDSTLMPRLELSSRLSRFKFFVSVGMYYRFASVLKGGSFPFQAKTDFTDWDFATQFGLETTLFNQFVWLNRVSTFDELETFNLNHPFIESAFFWRKKNQSFSLGISTRYQVLLGFGRLDRFMLGIAASKTF